MSKVLVVGPAWVGDMVMAQSLFKLLKQLNPQQSIEVLAPAWSQPLLARMPEVNNSMVMPLGHGQLEIAKRFSLGKSLRNKQFDQAIVLPNSFKSALIPFFANIPKRTGWLGEFRYLVLNDTRKLNEKKYPLMIERFMALALAPNAPLPRPYPLPELKISRDTQQTALSNHQLDFPTKPVLAIAPGAEFGPAKRWPENYYADIANQKLNEGWDVWIFGSQKDMPVAETIMSLTQQRCKNFSGKTKLEEAVDLIALATAVVSNDSGLMHIAAALHKPLVAVYGPTSAGFTPPLNEGAKVLSLQPPLSCQPCFQRECPLRHHRCMLDLKPAQVLAALQEVV